MHRTWWSTPWLCLWLLLAPWPPCKVSPAASTPPSLVLVQPLQATLDRPAPRQAAARVAGETVGAAMVVTTAAVVADAVVDVAAAVDVAAVADVAAVDVAAVDAAADSAAADSAAGAVVVEGFDLSAS